MFATASAICLATSRENLGIHFGKLVWLLTTDGERADRFAADHQGDETVGADPLGQEVTIDGKTLLALEIVAYDGALLVERLTADAFVPADLQADSKEVGGRPLDREKAEFLSPGIVDRDGGPVERYDATQCFGERVEQRFLRQAGDDGVVDLEQGAIALRGPLRLLERADLVARLHFAHALRAVPMVRVTRPPTLAVPATRRSRVHGYDIKCGGVRRERPLPWTAGDTTSGELARSGWRCCCYSGRSNKPVTRLHGPAPDYFCGMLLFHVSRWIFQPPSTFLSSVMKEPWSTCLPSAEVATYLPVSSA